jgi:hypothetical protein
MAYAALAPAAARANSLGGGRGRGASEPSGSAWGSQLNTAAERRAGSWWRRVRARGWRDPSRASAGELANGALSTAGEVAVPASHRRARGSAVNIAAGRRAGSWLPPQRTSAEV